MMRGPVVAAGVVAILAVAPAGAADCASEAKNLFAGKDCGFAKGVGGWTGVPDQSLGHESSDGDPGKGALAGSGPQGSLRLQAPCIVVRPDTDYRIAVRMKVASGSLYVCGYSVYQAADAACEDASDPLVADARPPEESWQPMTGEMRTGTDTKSVQLWLECSGEKGFRVLFDDLVFAPK